MSTPFFLRIFVVGGDPDGLRIVKSLGMTLPQVKAWTELGQSAHFFS